MNRCMGIKYLIVFVVTNTIVPSTSVWHNCHYGLSTGMSWDSNNFFLNSTYVFGPSLGIKGHKCIADLQSIIFWGFSPTVSLQAL